MAEQHLQNPMGVSATVLWHSFLAQSKSGVGDRQTGTGLWLHVNIRPSGGQLSRKWLHPHRGMEKLIPALLIEVFRLNCATEFHPFLFDETSIYSKPLSFLPTNANVSSQPQKTGHILGATHTKPHSMCACTVKFYLRKTDHG